MRCVDVLKGLYSIMSIREQAEGYPQFKLTLQYEVRRDLLRSLSCMSAAKTSTWPVCRPGAGISRWSPVSEYVRGRLLPVVGPASMPIEPADCDDVLAPVRGGRGGLLIETTELTLKSPATW